MPKALSFRELCVQLESHLESTTSSQIEALRDLEGKCAARRLALEASVPRPHKAMTTVRHRRYSLSPLSSDDIVSRTLPYLPLEALVASRRACKTWFQQVAAIRVSEDRPCVLRALNPVMCASPQRRLLGLVVLLRHGTNDVKELAVKRLDQQTRPDSYWNLQYCFSSRGTTVAASTDAPAARRRPQYRPPSFVDILKAGVLDLLKDMWGLQSTKIFSQSAAEAATSTLAHLAANGCAKNVADLVLKHETQTLAARLATKSTFTAAARLLEHCAPFLDARSLLLESGAIQCLVDELQHGHRQLTALEALGPFFHIGGDDATKKSKVLQQRHDDDTNNNGEGDLQSAVIFGSVAAGICPPLVALAKQYRNACLYLYKISEYDGAVGWLIAAGVVGEFVQMLKSTTMKLTAPEKQRAAKLLLNIAAKHTDGPAALVDAGAVPPLVHLLQKSNHRTREIVVGALHRLASLDPARILDECDPRDALTDLLQASTTTLKLQALVRDTLARFHNDDVPVVSPRVVKKAKKAPRVQPKPSALRKRSRTPVTPTTTTTTTEIPLPPTIVTPLHRSNLYLPPQPSLDTARRILHATRLSPNACTARFF